MSFRKGNESDVLAQGKIPYTVKGYGGDDPSNPEVRFNPHENGDGTFDPTMVDKYVKKNGKYELIESNLPVSAAMSEIKNSGKKIHTWEDQRKLAAMPWTTTENLKNALKWQYGNERNKFNIAITRSSKYQKADLKSDYDKRQQKAEQIKSNKLENSGI